MVVTVVHGGTSTAQHVALSQMPDAQIKESSNLFHPLGHVKLWQIGAGVVVTVVTMLQHRSELHAGPLALPQRRRSVFGAELAGQTKLAQVLGAAVVQGLDGRRVGLAVAGTAVMGSAVVGLVGNTVEGASVVRASVVGVSVSGASVARAVVGASVAGVSVAGACVVGIPVAGTSVVGISVVGPSVEGASVVGAANAERAQANTTNKAAVRIMLRAHKVYLRRAQGA